MASLRVPIATYRVQLNRSFRFGDVRVLLPYLHHLGISDLYTSPVLAARRRSLHGYDVIDPACLNAELGTDEDFDSLVADLKAHGMGLLLDIVPNHMAASPDNPWWMDVLENGCSSPYADFFDIEWEPPESTLRGRVLLPILGAPYHQVLEDRELVLGLDEQGLFLRYHDLRLPLNLKSYPLVLSYGLDGLRSMLGGDHAALRQFERLMEDIGRLPDPSTRQSRQTTRLPRRREAIKRALSRLVAGSPETSSFIADNVARFNGEKGDSFAPGLLERLLDQQVYQLAFWKTGREKINYRRFFDVSDLIGICVEKPHVFEATHAAILRLVHEGKVTGLRIDHIDGLADPPGYLARLQRRVAGDEGETSGKRPRFYVVVEKVLSGDEPLPRQWPVFGTTGYDFLNLLNALFVHPEGARALSATYARVTGCEETFADMVYRKKKQVIGQLFPAEVRRLGWYLARLAQQDTDARGLSQDALSGAIEAVTACLPVYRTYARSLRTTRRDRAYVEHAVHEARRQEPSIDTRALEFLRRLLILDASGTISRERKREWLRFVMRWQQFTGSVMAKGLEDTALYNYNRLVSLNDVGGDPGANGLSIEAFHQRNLTRQEQWPHALNATATHDTKRGEDARARLNVLSELPDEWEESLVRWQEWNRPKKRPVNGQLVPDPNMELLLYQTLVGAWPYAPEMSGFEDRLKAYLVKTAREAKVFTSWLSPNPEYEEALVGFSEAILDTSRSNLFLEDFLALQRRVAHYGIFNSLSQVLLKIASPGIPDFYQGTELWDLSLVDPDNRRPVDFALRQRLLDGLVQQEAGSRSDLVRGLMSSLEDGRAKMYLTCKALGIRQNYPNVFRRGDYIPLQADGRSREHVCAFARRWKGTWAIAAVPRLLAKLVPLARMPLGRDVWGDDMLLLPEQAPAAWRDTFTDATVCVSTSGRGLPLSSVFGMFPVALLLGGPM
ncbi:MAG: malto-oligosyltrehalose synthase [Chloroflexi bacterium]|nr:MAG: malto-oligosyltrehalose synthase [Chloroflexota bacterium]